MTNSVHDYLERLDAALGPVPYATAREIRAGIEEELGSLDGAAADQRMRELGDPAAIAAAAAGSLREGPTPSWAGGGATAPPSPPHRNGTASTVYVVLTGLAIAFGMWVVPIVGWIAGIVLMWMSVVWRRSEKIVATALPLVAFISLLVVTASLPRSDSQTSTIVTSGPGGDFHAPSIEEYGSAFPSLSYGFGLFWTGVLVIGALCFASGAWLLVIAFRRGLAPVSPGRAQAGSSGGQTDSGGAVTAIAIAMLVVGVLGAVWMGSVTRNPLNLITWLLFAIAGLVLLVVRALSRR